MTEERPAEQDADIERLLQAAGPRVTAPEAIKARVYAATRAAYDEQPTAPLRLPAGRNYSSRGWAVAAAALFALVVGSLLTLPRTGAPPAVASLTYATGAYTVRGEGDESHITVNTLISTTDRSRLQLTMASGVQIRLDAATQITIRSVDEVWLHAGRVYVDSGGAANLAVLTSGAAVRNIGTQYQVALAPDNLIVAVREGRVSVSLWNQVVEGRAQAGIGERLVFDQTSLVERQTLAFDAPVWHWTTQAAARFELKGASYDAYLRWAARETGRSLRYAAPVVEQWAGQNYFGGTGSSNSELSTVEQTLRATDLRLLPSATSELVVDFRR